ncbi:hypothetical protein [Pandoraea sputorum]
MSEIPVKVSVSVDQAEIARAEDAFLASAKNAITVKVEPAKPTICISCGAARQPNGQMPCEH